MASLRLRAALLALGLILASTVPAAAPLVIGYLSGSAEYNSNASLHSLAAEMESKHGCRSIHFTGKDQSEGSAPATPTTIANFDSLDQVDVLVVFSRRMWLADAQYKKLVAFCDKGKGMVGIRTASHGIQNWNEGRGLDSAVWGGAYNNHGTTLGYALEIPPAGAGHPVLAGVKTWKAGQHLYFQNLGGRTVASDATVLMIGSNADGRFPVAWARMRKGAPVFYTSTGVPEDFEDPAFRTLLVNALLWAGGRLEPVKVRGGATAAPASRGSRVPDLMRFSGSPGVGESVRADGRWVPTLPQAAAH
jgi:type 1 glutamine amidotransferase